MDKPWKYFYNEAAKIGDQISINMKEKHNSAKPGIVAPNMAPALLPSVNVSSAALNIFLLQRETIVKIN